MAHHMLKLTREQRRDWDTNGYICLEGVLGADEVAFFIDQLDEFRSRPGWEPMSAPLGHYGWMEHAKDLDSEGFMDRRDLLDYARCLHRADRSTWRIRPGGRHSWGRIWHSVCPQAIVRPSTPKFSGYTHTDGGEGLRRVRVTETSRPLAMKALYLLTDVGESDSSNFTVFPGSHRRPFPEPGDPAHYAANPGSGTVDGQGRRLCHFSACSLAWAWTQHFPDAPREDTLLYNYCQLFMRPYDYETVSAVKERCTASAAKAVRRSRLRLPAWFIYLCARGSA